MLIVRNDAKQPGLTIKRTFDLFYRLALQPKTTVTQVHRQELILNILLTSLLTAALIAMIAAVVTYLAGYGRLGLMPLIATSPFLLILLACRRAVNGGHVKAVSYVLIILLLLNTIHMAIRWGLALPQVLLSCVMIVVMGGILLGARVGIQITGIVVSLMAAGALAQINGWLRPDLTWQNTGFLLVDAIGYGLVVGFIGLVSWLSAREIDRSIKSAQYSRSALIKERDGLEMRVAARTKELRDIQAIRIVELERYAAFGKTSATLVHDLANPLMIAALDLQQLDASDKNKLLKVYDSISVVERHLEAARHQLRNKSFDRVFSISSELDKVVDMSKARAKDSGVSVVIEGPRDVNLYGDPNKFAQIFSNLLINAIESYEGAKANPKKKIVRIEIFELKTRIRISVSDYGCGINEANLEHVFDAFYSNKSVRNEFSGTGIGLSIVKRVVEQDFGGVVGVKSMIRKGSSFTITLPRRTA